MPSICKLVRTAQPQGEYQKTGTDNQKQDADFLLIDVSGFKNVIAWRGGAVERVSSRQLAKLQKLYKWMPNF